MKKAFLGLAALVVVLLVAGIVAPSLIDWTRYRDQVAAEIERALGRRVIIEGKVAATLIPAPRLSLFGARLGNLPGASTADMAQAEALDIRVALWPLLSGKIVIESVVLRRPVIALEILADGRRNWQFAPAGRDGGSADVRFEDAVVSDGIVTYRDARSGREERVEGVQGRFSADSLHGPLRATAELRYRAVPLRLSLSAGRLDPSGQRATPFNLKAELPGPARGLARSQTTRASGSLIGSLRWTDQGLRLGGDATLQGANLGDFMAALDGGVATDLLAQPFELDGAIEYGEGILNAKSLAMRLGEMRLQGAVAAALAEAPPRVDIDLNFGRVDLDAWLTAARSAAQAAAKAAPPPSPAGGERAPGAAADEFSLSSGVDLTLDVTADALTYRGGAFRQIKLAAELADGVAEIHQLSAQLTAGTDASFNGRLVAANGKPKVEGLVDIASDDFRGLAAWLGVDIAGLPTGRLNKVSAMAQIGATTEMLDIGEIDVRFDTTRITGAMVALLRDRPAIGANLIVDRIDLDSYRLPVAFPAARGGGGASPQTDAVTLVALLAGFDANLRLRVGELTTNRLTARQLLLDGTLADGVLTMAKLTFGELAGGGGFVSGTVTGFDGKPRVDLDFDFLSEQPASLLSALGIAFAFEDGALKPLSSSGKLAGSDEGYAIDATVVAGDTAIAVKGDLARMVDGAPRSAVDVKLQHPDYVEFLRLFDSAFAPRRAPSAVAVDLAARVEGGDSHFALSDIGGNLGPLALAGSAALAFEGSLPRLDAELALGDVDTGHFLPPARRGAESADAERWSGEPIDLDPTWIVGGHFSVSAKSLRHGRWSIGEPKIDFTLGDGGAELGQFSGRLMGGLLSAQGGISPSGRSETTMVLDYSMTLTGASPGPSLFGGTAIDIIGGRFDVTVEGAAVGASEATMLSAMTGKGSIVLRNSAIKGFDLARLNDGFAKLRSRAELVTLSESALAGGTTKVNSLRGTFSVIDGAIAVDDLVINSPSGQINALLAVDLPHWRLDATTELRLADQPTAPPVELQLSGPLDAPTREIASDRLQDFLRSILAARASRRPAPPPPAASPSAEPPSAASPPPESPPAKPQDAARPPSPSEVESFTRDVLRGLNP